MDILNLTSILLQYLETWFFEPAKKQQYLNYVTSYTLLFPYFQFST